MEEGVGHWLWRNGRDQIMEEGKMIRRLCGYQVKIKINAFRLRGRVATVGRKLGVGGALVARRLGVDEGISGLDSDEEDFESGTPPEGGKPGVQKLGIGDALGGCRVDKDYGGFDTEPAKKDLQASSSEKSIPDPGKGKKPISPFALAKASEVKALLNSDLNHHYSIAKLARKVGTNAKTLQDGFKQLFGETIFEYGQGLRLEHGKKLISETELGIQEIAEACGYAEQANFTAAFRKRFGVAPGVWRKGGKSEFL